MTQANRINDTDALFKQWFLINGREELSSSEFIELYQLSNQLIREIAQTHSVHLVDLDLLIPKTNEYIYDTVHFNKDGSKLVAHNISEKLLNIIDKSR
jgi:lysophospholipase L1-like esterase